MPTDLNSQAITGTLTLLPNPCTTRPCLPGMAFAITTARGETYFLTQNDALLMQDYAWGSNAPELGSQLRHIAQPREQTDINGRIFKTIEF